MSVNVLFAKFKIFNFGSPPNASDCIVEMLLSTWFWKHKVDSVSNTPGQHGSVWTNWITLQVQKDCTHQLFEIILRDAGQSILLKRKRSVNLGDPCRAPGWIEISLLFTKLRERSSSISLNAPVSILVILLSLNSRNRGDKGNSGNECLLIDSISLNAKPNHNKCDTTADESWDISLILLEVRYGEMQLLQLAEQIRWQRYNVTV